jgi:hypothetical protein
MKKDPIDRLFEEKLKDHSEVPDPKVWKAIEASLDKKKKSRKVVPFWWKFAGAAAILLFALYLLNPIADSNVPVDSISDTEKASPNLPGNQASSPGDTVVIPNEKGAVVAGPGKKDSQASSGPSRAEDEGQTAETPDPRSGKIPEATLARSGNAGKAASGIKGQDDQQRAGKPDTTLSEVTGIQDKSDKRPSFVESGGGVNPGDQPDVRDARTIADGQADKKTPFKDLEPEAIVETSREQEEEEAGKKSIYDEIAEKESPEIAENNGPHWSVGPRVAPVYFNSFGQGSPIHSNFVSNSKSGNINLSYGIALSYNISPKLSVRSGINKVDYGYDTNEISFSPALAVSSNEKINNIDYSLSSRNLIVRNSSEARAAQDALAVEVSAQNPERDGRMVQQFGYIEVPLELNYALVDRKLGIHLIGGLSSLFLVDNSVTLESNGDTTEMGAANNLNSLNFSTNIGLGIQYELSSKLQLNVEPVFKYQLNTFSDAAGNFNPYSIGVYSGLSLKF